MSNPVQTPPAPAPAPAISPPRSEGPPPQPRAEDKPKSAVRTWIIRGVVAIVILAGIVWGVSKFIYSRSHETSDDAQMAGHVIPSIPKVSGYVQRVYVNDNQFVKAGDTLVTLDPRDYTVAVARAEADLRSALAAGRKGSATSAVNVAEAQRTALNADVAVAEANAERAHLDVGRIQELAARNIVSQQQLDQAVAADKAATAQLAAAQALAVSGGANVQGANYQVNNADYRVASAQAAVDNARLQLAYTTLTAPVTGFVARKTVEIGQFVQAGQQLLAVVESDTAWVVANMKETQMDDIRPGQDVIVSIDAFNGAKFHGKVASIQDGTGATFALLPPDNATGNFTKIVQRVPVKIALDSTSYRGRPLSPGLSVDVAIDTKSDSASRNARNKR